MIDDRFQQWSTHVVEVDIDAGRAVFGKRCVHLRGPVIDDGVVADFLDESRCLGVVTTDADNLRRTHDARNLSGNVTHGTRCSGHKHGVARLRFCDVVHAEVSRHAGVAQDAQVVAERRIGIVSERDHEVVAGN